MSSSMYVVYSRLSLDYLNDEFFPHYGNSKGIGLMKVETSNGKETNRALVILSDDIFEALDNAGFTKLTKDRNPNVRQVDFRIAPFELRDRDYPKEGHGPNLYIPLSSKWNATEYYSYFGDIFASFVKFGLVGEGDYLVKIPLESRTSDKHKGSCFISFKDTVPLDKIAKIRTFLYDYEDLKCFWAKAEKKREKVDKVDKVTKVSKKSKSKPKSKLVVAPKILLKDNYVVVESSTDAWTN